MTAAATPEIERGLRARKKAEARARLVDAALALFAKRGADAVTVDEIALAADVSRRTFFRYFPTKEAVVLERRRAQLAALERLLAAPPGSVPVGEVIRSALEALALDYERHRSQVLAERALFARSSALALADLELDRAFEQAFAAAVLTRLAPVAAPGARSARRRGSRALSHAHAESAPPELRRRARTFAAALMAVVRVALEEWAESKARTPLHALGSEAVDAVLGWLGPAKGAVVSSQPSAVS